MIKLIKLFSILAMSVLASNSYASDRNGSYVLVNNQERCPKLIIVNVEESLSGKKISIEKYLSDDSSFEVFRNESIKNGKMLTHNVVKTSSVRQEQYQRKIFSKTLLYTQEFKFVDEVSLDYDLLFLETNLRLINSSTLLCEYIKE
jgi:hypothetical protein